MTKPSYEELRITKHSGSPQSADSASDDKSSRTAKETRRFRKKPVVVEAVQWFKHGDHPFVNRYEEGTVEQYPIYKNCGWIKTLESGTVMHNVMPGDWIIRGIKGELYPCKPDIFAETYQPWFGDGDYSCATCGLGMVEPCEHWTNFQQSAKADDATTGVDESASNA